MPPEAGAEQGTTIKKRKKTPSAMQFEVNSTQGRAAVCSTVCSTCYSIPPSKSSSSLEPAQGGGGERGPIMADMEFDFVAGSGLGRLLVRMPVGQVQAVLGDDRQQACFCARLQLAGEGNVSTENNEAIAEAFVRSL